MSRRTVQEDPDSSRIGMKSWLRNASPTVVSIIVSTVVLTFLTAVLSIVAITGAAFPNERNMLALAVPASLVSALTAVVLLISAWLLIRRSAGQTRDSDRSPPGQWLRAVVLGVILLLSGPLLVVVGSWLQTLLPRSLSSDVEWADVLVVYAGPPVGIAGATVLITASVLSLRRKQRHQ